MANKARKRQQQYKKQHAYQVALEKKLREVNKEEQLEKEEVKIEKIEMNRQITDMEWNLIKQEIAKVKHNNDEILKHIEVSRKDFKKLKEQNKVQG